jgi:hypothetical protein
MTLSREALPHEEVAPLPWTRRVIRGVERAIQTRYPLFLLLVVAYLVPEEIVKTHLDGYVDWLYISTIALFMLGLLLATSLPKRMERTIIRLANRGSLRISEEEIPAFLLTFERRSARWALIGGVLGVVALLSAYVFTGSLGFTTPDLRIVINILALVVETCVGFFMGYYAGYAASNGLLGRFLKQREVKLHAQPGHLDGVAGFRPVGAFYFSQAGLLGLVALFLAVWWVLIGLPSDPFDLATHNGSWRTPYLAFFFVVILAELLAFVLPLWSFHLELQAQRRDLLLVSDKLSQRIAALQTQLVMNPLNEKAHELKEQQSALTEYYWAIQRMPTWPVSTGTWRRFLLSTLALLAPLAAQLVIEHVSIFAFLR